MFCEPIDWSKRWPNITAYARKPKESDNKGNRLGFNFLFRKLAIVQNFRFKSLPLFKSIPRSILRTLNISLIIFAFLLHWTDFEVWITLCFFYYIYGIRLGDILCKRKGKRVRDMLLPKNDHHEIFYLRGLLVLRTWKRVRLSAWKFHK